MFTASEIEYLRALVDDYLYNKGYDYYVAYTISNTSGDTDDYDFIVVFSKDKITNTKGNNFVCSSDQEIIKVDSSSGGRNSTHDRYVYSTSPARSFSVNNYEHIYSNAIDTKHADVVSYHNRDIINMYTICVVISIFLLCWILRWVFPNAIGD